MNALDFDHDDGLFKAAVGAVRPLNASHDDQAQALKFLVHLVGDILLKEYHVVRTEIMTRTNQQFALMTFGSVTFAWLLSRGLSWVTWAGCAVVAAILGNLYCILQVVVWRAGQRGYEQEQIINAMAGQELLRWETHWGGAIHGSYARTPAGAAIGEPPLK